MTTTSNGSPISVDLLLDETAPDTDLANFGAAGVSYKVNLTGVGSLQTPVGNGGFDLVTPSGSGADFGIYNSTLVPQIQDGVLFPAPEFSSSFSAVPEPGSVVTCTALGTFGVLRRRRRKKAGEADRWKRWKRRQRKKRTPETGFVTSKNWH